MNDLVIRNCLNFQQEKIDILIKNGKIAELSKKIQISDIPEIDANEHFVTSPFIDCHFHMDATLSYGLPRINESGTLLEGINLWGELKKDLTPDAVKNRARKLCKWSIARGTLGIRTHVDVSGDSLMAVEALIDVKNEMKEFLDIQLVAFPQDGLYRANCLNNLETSLKMGVEVVGGIPHFERTMLDGTSSVKTLCELAEKRSFGRHAL